MNKELKELRIKILAAEKSIFERNYKTIKKEKRLISKLNNKIKNNE